MTKITYKLKNKDLGLLKNVNLFLSKSTAMKLSSFLLSISVLLMLTLNFPSLVFSQTDNIGIGTTNPDNSSLLELYSTSKGLLIPRMTTVQRDAISSPATGLIIYNTDNNKFQFNQGTPGVPDWVNLVSGLAGDVFGSGALGQIAYWNSSSTITGSASLFWDISNTRLGVGTNSPRERLDIKDASDNGAIVIGNAIGTTAGTIQYNGSDFLGYDGSSWVSLSASSTITGNGLANQVTFWSAAGILSGSNDLYWDGANTKLGIGISTPRERLDIKDASNNGAIIIGNASGTNAGTIQYNGSDFLGYDGSSWVSLSSSSTLTGNGSANQLTFWSAAGTIAGDNDLYWDPSNNILGIGTAAPASTVTLDVNGNARIQGDLEVTGQIDPVSITLQPQSSAPAAVEGKLYYDNSSNQMKYYNGSAWSYLGLWSESGGNAYRSSGYVGIGTSTPREALDLQDGSGNGALIVGNSTNSYSGEIKWDGFDFYGYDGSNWLSLTSGGGGGGGSSTITGAGAAGEVTIWSSTSTLMGTSNLYWNNVASRLGIGDNTPDHSLDVAGNIGMNAGGYINFGDVDGTSGYGFRDNSGNIQYKNSGGSWSNFSSLSGGDVYGSGSNGQIAFWNSSSTITGGINLYWDNSNYRLGISDATPDHSLDVAGNIGLDAGGFINFGDVDGATGYGFRDNGGTLQFKNSAGAWRNFASGNTLDDAYNQGGAGAGRTVVVDGGAIQFNGSQATDETLEITNDAAGGVLYLNNSGTGYSLYIDDFSSSYPVVVDANGNIGIGTSSPGAQLDVRPNDANAIRIEPYNTGIGSTSRLEFMELLANGVDYVGFKAPDNISSNVIWVLPNSDGSNGQVLSTDGSGNLSWASTTGGGNVYGNGSNGQIAFWNSSSTITGGINLYWDNSNYRLGIADATPDHSLDVAGNIGLDASGYINFGDVDGATGYGFRDNAGILQFKNSAGAWRNFASGNTLDQAYDQGGAGAGRTIAVSDGAVQLQGSNATDETLEITNSANGGVLYLANSGTGNSIYVQDNASTYPFVIDASGNVGVGLSSPTAQLEITSSDANSLRLNPYSTGAGNTGGLQFMELAANGTNYVGFKAPDNIASNLIWVLPNADGTNGQVLSTDGSGNLSWASAGGNTLDQAYDQGGAGAGRTLNVSDGAVQFQGSNAADETVEITTSANGGVLYLENNGTGNSLLVQDNAASYPFVIDANGNVGVGLSSPTAQLEITSSDANTLRLNPYGTASGNTGGLQFMELAANGTNYVGFKAPDNITSNLIWVLPNADGTNGQALTTDGSGNLTWASSGGNTLDQAYDQGGAGAGRTVTVDNGAIQFTGSNAADETLEITNSANGGVLLIENTGTGTTLQVNDQASDTSPFVIDANGNVGIGTTTINDKLQVAGAVLRDGFFMARRSSDQAGFDNTAQTIDWNAQIRYDTDYYTHSTGLNPDEITIDVTGWYRISYNINIWNNDNNRQSIRNWIEDDGTEIVGSLSIAYARTNGQGEYSSSGNSFIAYIAANSVITVVTQSTRGSADYRVYRNSQITIERIDQ